MLINPNTSVNYLIRAKDKVREFTFMPKETSMLANGNKILYKATVYTSSLMVKNMKVRFRKV
jgi:hypothetical protein